MVDKVTDPDIVDKQTTGEQGASLINDTKRAINQTIDAKEEALGNPSINGQVLASTTAGVRSWVDQSAGGGAVDSVNGRTGAVLLDKADVGLSQIDNTSDADKPLSTASQTALDTKVDKVAGKGLSEEDYTTVEKSKLVGIEAGAEVNVKSDWNEGDNTSDAFIGNKPTIPTNTSDLTNDSNFIPDAPADGNQYARKDNLWEVLAAGGGAVDSVNGRTGAVTLTKSDVNLANVDNTSDIDKPVSTATQTALDNKEDSLGNPASDGQVLSSTAAGVRSWVDQSGGGGGGFTNDPYFDVFEGSLADTDPAVGVLLKEGYKIETPTGVVNTVAIKPKWRLPPQTYFEFGRESVVGSIFVSTFVIISPITHSGVDYSKGVRFMSGLVTALATVTAGTSPRSRTFGAFTNSITNPLVGASVGGYIGVSGGVFTFTISTSSNSSTLTSNIPVEDVLGWDIEIQEDRSLAPSSGVNFVNFGTAPFQLPIPAGAKILSDSRMVNDNAVNLWQGSSTTPISTSLMEYPIGDSGIAGRPNLGRFVAYRSTLNYRGYADITEDLDAFGMLRVATFSNIMSHAFCVYVKAAATFGIINYNNNADGTSGQIDTLMQTIDYRPLGT